MGDIAVAQIEEHSPLGVRAGLREEGGADHLAAEEEVVVPLHEADDGLKETVTVNVVVAVIHHALPETSEQLFCS